jgi:hypothetical protein
MMQDGMIRSWVGAVALSLSLAASCGPSPKAPVKVMVLAASNNGGLGNRQVELSTIGNLTNLRGLVAEFIGGARVVEDMNDPLQAGGTLNLTTAQRYEVLVKDKGAWPRGHFIERGDVYWPGDFHTWNMATAYYNLERTYLYFQTLYPNSATGAVDPALVEMQNTRVMYWPDVRLNSPTPIVDNALYLSALDTMVLAPFEQAQSLPLAMNLGVIGHEMAHRLFNARVFEKDGVPDYLIAWESRPAANLMRSLDEGLADFHGYSATCFDDSSNCQPNFLPLSTGVMTNQRDVSNVSACMTDGLKNALENTLPVEWRTKPELYTYGNLWAVALFQAGSKPGPMGSASRIDAVRRALPRAYNNQDSPKLDLKRWVRQNLSSPQAVTPESIANIIVDNMPDDTILKRDVCDELTRRLGLSCASFPCAEMPACPATSQRRACP